jgi:hypothetical protein
MIALATTRPAALPSHGNANPPVEKIITRSFSFSDHHP